MKEKLAKLKSLYNEIPSIPCARCARCCTAVTMTMIEFIYLFKFICQIYDKEKIINLLYRIEKSVEGHTIWCPLLSHNACLAYEARPFFCRIYGIPFLKNSQNAACKNKKYRKVYPLINNSYYKRWYRRILELNDLKCPNLPLLKRGLKIEEWFSIYFDESPFHQELLELQGNLKKELNLEFLKTYYIDKVKYSKKIERILVIQDYLQDGNLRDAILKFKEMFGSYYFNLIFQKRDIHMALLELARLVRTFAKTPLAGYTLFQLALFYQSIGAWEKVVEELLKFISHYPTHPQIEEAYYRIGWVYQQKLKNPIRSREVFLFLINNFPSGTFAKYAMKRLFTRRALQEAIN